MPGLRTGLSSCCKPCHDARTRRSKEVAGGGRTHHLRRRYGITAEEADAMPAAQGGLCAICRAAPAVHVDHDHATGAVRALLCSGCNGGLGPFEDDPAFLHAAASHVALHTARQEVAAARRSAGDGPDGPSRPESPPVGSQRSTGRPGSRPATGRRSSVGRSQRAAGEADG